MAESRFRRDLSALLKDFKPQTMKWPDVVQRLRQLKAVIKQHSTIRVPEPDLLGKCLMLCLHKSWPMGLHSEALDVYSALLFPEPSPTPVPDFNSEFAVYANSLFCFYDLASPENKATLLRMFHKLVSVYSTSAGLFMPGLVINLLSGLDDPGNREATPEILRLFETLTQLQESTFHSSLWIAVLRTSSETRVRALNYLLRRRELFIPNRQLVLNVLIACLEDPEMRVKRATLDFIVAKMNLLDNGQYLDEEKVAVLVAVIRLLGRDRDPSILRRVKDWIIPQDYVQYVLRLSDYCAQAVALLLSTFSESEQEVKDSIFVIHCLLEVLGETAPLKQMLLKRLASVLVTHVYRNKTSPMFASLLGLLSEFFDEESSRQTWESLGLQTSTTIRTDKAGETLNIIEFALSHVPLDQTQSTALHPILLLLLQSFSVLPPSIQLQALSIALILLQKIETPPSGTRFQTHLTALFREQRQSELLQVATEVCVALQEPGDWVLLIKEMCLSANLDQALSGIEGGCKICAKPAFAKYFDAEMIHKVFVILWTLLGSPANDRAVRLFVNWQRLKRTEFEAMTVEKLSAADVGDRALALQQFAVLWASLRRLCCDEIGDLFYSGSEVYAMLEGLDSESPQIRHAVREWLLDSLPTLRFVIDPFIEPLLSVPQREKDPNRGRLFYVSHYDTSTVLKCLKKLRSLLLRGGDKLHTWLRDTLLSVRMVKCSPEDFEMTYLRFLAKAALVLVEGEADPKDTAFFYEDQAVRFSACEVIESALEKGESQIAFAASKPFLAVTLSAIQDQNSLFQLQLLNILRIILMNSDSSKDVKKCKELFVCSEFVGVLVTSVESQDAYLLGHWTEFVCQLFPLVLKWMSGVSLSTCTRQLVQTFAHIIKVGEAKEMAFKGLTTIINSIVDLPNQTISMVFVEELKTAKKAKESGWFSFFGKSHSPAASTPFDELNNNLVMCFEAIFEGCYKCLSPKNLGFHTSPLGLEIADKPVEGWVADAHSESIRGVLMPLFSKWPVEFFAAAMALWLDSTVNKPISKESPLLVNLIRLFSYIGLSPYELLGPLSSFLRVRLVNFKGFHETNLLHFITTLLVSYPAEAYQMNPDEQKLYVSALVSILEALDQELSGKVEAHFWELELLMLMNKVVPFAVVDKQTKSRLQDFVKALLAKICRLCSEKNPSNPPFSPSIMQLSQEVLHIQAAAFRILSVHLYPALKLVYESEVKELREQLRGPVMILTNGLAKRDIPMHMLTSLLHALVKSEGQFITDVLRDTLTSTLRSDQFFKQLERNVVSLQQWAVILETMNLYSTKDRRQIIEEILADIPSGMFTSRGDILKGTVKALKTAAFLIFSGGIDGYKDAVRMLVDRLMNEFNGDDVLPSSLLLLRALVLRLSQAEWGEMYELLRPHLITRLGQVLREPTIGLKVHVAALKLLELLVALGYEQFAASQWLFLYDSPNVDFCDVKDLVFRPMVSASLLPTMSYRLLRQDETNISVISRASYSLRATPRVCFFMRPEYGNLDEFLGRGEPFIRYMVSSCVERLAANYEELSLALENDLLYCEEG